MRHVNDNYGLKRGVKEILSNRRPVGINVVGSVKGHVYAYQLYDCLFTDGHSEIMRGSNLRTYYNSNDLNGTEVQKKASLVTFHPEFEPALRACVALLEGISNRCWDFDLPDKPKKKRKKGIRK